ncbi:MAG: stage V sporulation protein AC [Ruminococcus sp.]|nr:stage V sporulation protein AC [Ruminococcus sp.]
MDRFVEKTGIDRRQYERMYKSADKSSPLAKNVAKAFFTGGAICLIGQIISSIYSAAGLGEDDASLAVSVTLVALSVLLTGLGLYEKLATQAGAGTLVPITGFANSVAAPALEFKTEGLVTGLGSKIFVICGPVILYGTLASFIYGAVYFLSTL